MKATKKKTDLAKSEDGLALQKLLMDNGAIDVAALNKLLAKSGIKAVQAALQEERYVRKAKKAEWATKDRTLSEVERGTVERLPDVIGIAPAITSEEDARALTQAEIDLWAEELLIEREVTDILEGLKERMRSTFINVTAFENDGDPLVDEPREFKSPKHGFKVVVSKSGRGGNPDYTKLEEVLDEDTWKAITDRVVTRTVNEDKLAKALADGKVSMDQFASLVPEKKEWPVVSPKAMKEGEEL